MAEPPLASTRAHCSGEVNCSGCCRCNSGAMGLFQRSPLKSEQRHLGLFCGFHLPKKYLAYNMSTQSLFLSCLLKPCSASPMLTSLLPLSSPVTVSGVSVECLSFFWLMLLFCSVFSLLFSKLMLFSLLSYVINFGTVTVLPHATIQDLKKCYEQVICGFEYLRATQCMRVSSSHVYRMRFVGHKAALLPSCPKENLRTLN